MNSIYLIRHGETQWNVEGKAQGEADICLNDHGREQAKITGMYLKSRNPGIDCIFSSPLIRARETAQIIKEQLDLSIPLEILDDLREHMQGKCLGKTEVDKMNDRDFDDYFAALQIQDKIMDPIERAKYQKKIDQESVKLNVESDHDCILRAKRVFNQILNTPYKRVIVVSHSGTIWAILSNLTHYQSHWSGENCSISYIEYNDGDYEVITLPNTEHMELDYINPI